MFKFKETLKTKTYSSENYNYVFDKETGFFARWGKTQEEDPIMAPFGPEILDIEITDICHGVTNIDGKRKVCDFCYKSNTPNGKNMSFESFKTIFDKFPKEILGQIAFGSDSQATSNPDLFKMMWYCRDNGVIPNITVAEISDDIADQLVKVCGAVAVSCYENKDICYNSVKKLTDRGLKQCNIHYMISSETYEKCFEIINDIKNDPRLEKLNAIVLLSLKKKGRGIKYHSVSAEKIKTLVEFAFTKKINLGFDSCSGIKFLKSVKNDKNFEQYKMMCEPCESNLFSFYVNCEGFGFPCSFTENTDGWNNGINLLEIKNFTEEVWNNGRIQNFRDNLLNTCSRNEFGCRECPMFEV